MNALGHRAGTGVNTLANSRTGVVHWPTRSHPSCVWLSRFLVISHSAVVRHRPLRTRPWNRTLPYQMEVIHPSTSTSAVHNSLTGLTKFNMTCHSRSRTCPVSTSTQALLRPSRNSTLQPLHTVTSQIVTTERMMEVALGPHVGPVKRVNGISPFGLARVGQGIPTRLFGPFESACVETLRYFF